MKFQNITVSGITDIVINREAKWVHLPSGVWQKQIPKGADDVGGRGVYTHEQMMEIVEHLKNRQAVQNVDCYWRRWVA